MNRDDDGVFGTPPSSPLLQSTRTPRTAQTTPRRGRVTDDWHQPPYSVGATPSPAREDDTKGAVRTVTIDFGDEYTGEVVQQNGVSVPHGQGTLLSRSGRHCYVGDFSHRWRDGYGKLVTERYVLWSRWRMNRPELTNSCRVDYPGGDKYSGFVAMRPDPTTPASAPRGGRMSNFSAWVQSMTPVRDRWGELVTAAGDRYFGEWEENRPHGFGCYVASSGDRYIGRFRHGKFHDTGALFSRTYAQDGVSRLPDGAFASAAGASPRGKEGRGVVARPVASPLCVFDGVWADGRLLGEGHVTLPGGTRVSADWRGASQPVEGEVVFAPLKGRTRDGRGSTADGVGGGSGGRERWRECFHWEPLLCGSFAELRGREYEAAQPLRTRLAHALSSAAVGRQESTEPLRGVLKEFLETSKQLRAAVRIFRRCFFFLYGTCGLNAEIGGGQGANALGWCFQRNPFGGCIHPGRGRAITPSDIGDAHVDIFSLTRSALRWTAEMLGDDTVQRLDMAGVPADLTVGRWVVDAVLADTHAVLLNLYVHAYSAEETEVDKALCRLRGRATLDDMGVEFARRHSEERLFDPYADAVHCIKQLGTPAHATLSAKLAVLTQWSRDIDLSTRLAQAGDDGSRGKGGGRGGARGVPACRAVANAQSGSADDLLPIHQFVLSQARVAHLHAHTRMLADFAEEPMFVDATSQESFCVTNLLVCTMTLPLLHQGLRDSGGVLVPASLFVDRLRQTVQGIPRAAHDATTRTAMDISADDLGCVALGYLVSWLPDALEALAIAPRPLPLVLSLDSAGDAARGVLPVRVCHCALLETLDGGEGCDSGARMARDFCWRAAGSVLASVGVGWGFCPAGGASESAASVVPFTLDTREDLKEGTVVNLCAAAPQLSVPSHTLPSFLLLVRDALTALL